MTPPPPPAEQHARDTATHWFEADPNWFKTAVFYELHLRAFFDANNDGSGDFRGLTEKLDYLQWLGVDCIWLLPTYPSPLRDGGYDIADFLGVHPDYGTLDDVKEFLEAAHEKGMRVITDLVMNHTSSDHPWFQESRQPGSAKRDWYVWSDTDELYEDARIIFTDTEVSNWTWDPEAGAYYWHRFFSHQPDLNYENPEVQEAMIDVLRFWLDLGLDGFRLDAVPYLFEEDGTNCENLPRTHEFLRKVRSTVDAEYPDRVLLAEANQWPEDVVDYFGDDDECHMAFHFPVMPRMFMALRREDATPIVEILERTPAIPPGCQWGLFLRNHDELTLEMVTDEERDYMYSEYAKDPRMKINVGIRRRLAPLLDNSRDDITLLHAILFSLPGSPILYYGDEIAMGDNVYLGDRDGVRTPMQWTGDRNGGFSRADFAQLYAPPLMDPVYGFQAVNVEAQLRTPNSLLRWIQRFVALRKEHPVFGLGTYRSLKTSNDKIFAVLREYEGDTVLCVHNIARSAQAVELDLGEFEGRWPEEMLGRTRFPRIGELPYLLTLAPRGFFWFRLTEEERPEERFDAALARAEEAAEAADAADATSESSRPTHAKEVGRMTPIADALDSIDLDALTRWVTGQRWFSAKSREVTVDVRTSIPLCADPGIGLLIAEARTAAGTHELFQLVVGTDGDELAFDVLDDPERAAAFADLLRGGADVPGDEHTVTVAWSDGAPALGDPPTVRTLKAEQSNSSIVIDDAVILKVFRHLEPGENPELEMLEFLSTHGFDSAPTLVGSYSLQGDLIDATLGVAQEFLGSAVDGWDLAHAELTTGRTDRLTPRLVELGEVVGRMHSALGSDATDPDFAPEEASDEALPIFMATVDEEIEQVFSKLPEHEVFAPILGRGDDLRDRLRRMSQGGSVGRLIRHHGDLHLGQTMLDDTRWTILDFEGEPSRPLRERRRKRSPLRDVAGMLRSFAYAASAAQRAGATLPSAWESSARSSFLEGYRSSVEPSLLPAGEAAFRQVLAIFELEKAVYELRYEIDNRPDWAAIPVAGIARLLEDEDTA